MLPRIRCAHTFLGAVVMLGALACDDATVGQLTVAGEFEPEMLDFGDVPVGMSKTLTASLRNTGVPIFEIERFEIPRSFTLPGLKASLEGHRIAPGDVMALDVGFIAMAEGEVTGDLVIFSGNAEVTLKLRANGVMLRAPLFAIEPASLDFGQVEVNTEERRTVTIRNTGNALGTIERIEVASGSSEFRVDGPQAFDIPEGGEATASVVFRPSVQGPRGDRLTFVPAGRYAPLPLDVSGQGVVPLGEILCTPTTVDFGRVERGLSATRQVTCEARGGAARLISASISNSGAPYFRLTRPPSTIDLQTGQSATIDVDYVPDGLPMAHTNTLEVRFSGGNGAGTARVTLRGEVIPPPPTATAISIVLRWNTNGTDVDLHLLRPNGAVFQPSDCYYANPSPDWGAQGNPSDNPYLDVDDVDGRGPETINLSQTANGQYRVMIHYYADNFQGPSTATVEVYVAGSLAGTFTQTLSCDDLWTVGTVTWNGTTGTFSPSTQVQPRSNHGVCL